MKMEKEKLQLAQIDLAEACKTKSLRSVHRDFSLSPHQLELLELMVQGLSIEQIVNTFLQKRVLVSFRDLHSLLAFLVAERRIQNLSLIRYFQSQPQTNGPSSGSHFEFDGHSGHQGGQNWADEMRHLPFFRSLDPRLIDVFMRSANFAEVPAGLVICHEGQRQRNLFALLDGEVAVLKNGIDGHKRQVAVLCGGSVFGEVGFFMNEPRTADVVTQKPSRVARFKYQSEVWDSMIKQDVARQLQKRFWLIHALTKSELFGSLPEDCFDALLFAGELREFPAGQRLCAEGEAGESCYVIVQGHVAITQQGRHLRVLGQGDCFGEVALVRTQGKRSATVTAETDLLALEIHYRNFYRLLSENLPLAYEIEKLALSRLADDRQATPPQKKRA